jgi:hypothetical protein
MLNSFPRFFSGMRAAVWLWVQPVFLFCMYSVLAQALYFFQLAFHQLYFQLKKIMCLMCVGIHTTQKA